VRTLAAITVALLAVTGVAARYNARPSSCSWARIDWADDFAASVCAKPMNGGSQRSRLTCDGVWLYGPRVWSPNLWSPRECPEGDQMTSIAIILYSS
jgi:hypothetical protein